MLLDADLRRYCYLDFSGRASMICRRGKDLSKSSVARMESVFGSGSLCYQGKFKCTFTLGSTGRNGMVLRICSY